MFALHDLFLLGPDVRQQLLVFPTVDELQDVVFGERARELVLGDVFAVFGLEVDDPQGRVA